MVTTIWASIIPDFSVAHLSGVFSSALRTDPKIPSPETWKNFISWQFVVRRPFSSKIRIRSKQRIVTWEHPLIVTHRTIEQIWCSVLSQIKCVTDSGKRFFSTNRASKVDFLLGIQSVLFWNFTFILVIIPPVPDFRVLLNKIEITCHGSVFSALSLMTDDYVARTVSSEKPTHACEKLHATVRTSKMGSESRTNPKLFWFIWIVCPIIPPVSNGRTKCQHVIFRITFGWISTLWACHRKNTTVTPNADYAVNITLNANTTCRALQICNVMRTSCKVFDRNCISFVPPLKDLRTFVNQRSTLFHCSFGSTCGCTALLTPKNTVRSVCILNKRVVSPSF